MTLSDKLLYAKPLHCFPIIKSIKQIAQGRLIRFNGIFPLRVFPIIILITVSIIFMNLPLSFDMYNTCLLFHIIQIYVFFSHFLWNEYFKSSTKMRADPFHFREETQELIFIGKCSPVL